VSKRPKSKPLHFRSDQKREVADLRRQIRDLTQDLTQQNNLPGVKSLCCAAEHAFNLNAEFDAPLDPDWIEEACLDLAARLTASLANRANNRRPLQQQAKAFLDQVLARLEAMEAAQKVQEQVLYRVELGLARLELEGLPLPRS